MRHTPAATVGAFFLALSVPLRLFMLVDSYVTMIRRLGPQHLAVAYYSTLSRRSVDPSRTQTPFRIHYPRILFSDKNEKRADGDSPDYAREETILCMDLVVQPGVAPDQAMAKVSQFCQSFPFAAVLPVQPLQYLPVYEDGGVEVKFLRKKTNLKSGVDGGVRFFIQESQPENDNDDDDDDDDDDENEITVAATLSSSSTTLIEVTAKRNSKGQTIAKLMAEKLIVTNFVAAMTGASEARQGLGVSIPMEDYVQVRSIYHKWM